jgi:hypothetical protein
MVQSTQPVTTILALRRKPTGRGCHQVGDKLIINGVFDGFFLRIKIACA